MGRVVTAMGEMLGIVLLRFPLIPRIWVIWLLAVNAVGLVFITRIEAQVHLATTVTAVMIMAGDLSANEIHAPARCCACSVGADVSVDGVPDRRDCGRPNAGRVGAGAVHHELDLSFHRCR